MRYSAKHKEQTRAKLLKKASKRFREEGLQSTGIAKLMRDMGLTHGGFYGHFRSKNDLVATALKDMFAETTEDLKKAIAGSTPGKEVSAIVNFYLSARNREHPELSCLLPTLASEIARQPKSIRQVYTQGFAEQVARLARFMPGDDEAEKNQRAHSFIAAMAGTMMFARAVSDPRLSDQILAQARDSYISIFEAKTSGKS
jgi:TetR/AcrR family transcriptional regulator, transcriptional repressor for nem operon